MQVLDKEVLSQLVGGLEVIDDAPGGPAGDGGGGFGGGGGGGGGFPDVRGYAYDLAAVGVEGGQQAVVRISGAIPVFDNPPPNVSIGQEPPAWEGSLLGMYVEPHISGRHEMLDDLLLGAVWSTSSHAATHTISKTLEGAGILKYSPGAVKVAGMAIGTAITVGSYMLLERDHPKRDGRTQWKDTREVPHIERGPELEMDDMVRVTSYTGSAGGNMRQMVF